MISAILLCLAITGCRSGESGYATAEGTVTVDGRPVSGAVVTFEPLEGTGGPKASVPVIEGNYAVPVESRLVGGEYLVRISMIPDEMLGPMRVSLKDPFPPAGSVIAPAYDAQSTLQRSLIVDQPNRFDFEVELLP